MAPLEFYQRALEYQDERFKRTFEAETEYLVRHIVDLAQEKKGLVKVLDVGCGNGRTMHNLDQELSNKHPNIMFYLTGIDSNPEKLKVVKKISGARFVHGNIVTDTTLQRESFDLVYSSYNTIGCIQDGTLTEMIESMLHLTRPDGEIINITWNSVDATTDFLKNYYKSIGFDPVYVFGDLSVCVDPENKDVYRFNRVRHNEIERAFLHAKSEHVNVGAVLIDPLWKAYEVKK